MAGCLGFFTRHRNPRASSESPAKSRHHPLPGVPGGQVSDVTHLVGVGADATGGRQMSKLRTLVQTPEYGEHAYELVGHLGDAQAGTMKLMRHKRSKDLVAVKFVKLSSDMLLDKNVEREILNHRQLTHPNILAFREVFTTSTELAIVVEYASAGKLADRCDGQRMSEKQARELFCQLLDGLAYCHSKGVFHRDLRTDHILLSGSVFQPMLKIGGFGYSKSAAMDSMAKTMVGARGYMAPEVLLSTGRYDAAGVDVWACGVILFQLLAGRMPFCHDTQASGVLDHAMMQRIVRGQYYLPGDLALSLEVQDLLARIFRPDPAKRITLAELRRHPWLGEVPSVLGSVPTPQDEAPAAAATAAPQSEDGIRDVIQRARQRRLLRQSTRQSAQTAAQTDLDPDGMEVLSLRSLPSGRKKMYDQRLLQAEQ